MGHGLGPQSHVCIASLLGLLLAMLMKIWDCECGPFRPNFPAFAILGQVGVRFSCNLYSGFFQCKILIYVHPQKTTIPALFRTVLVSVDQEFL